MSMDSAGVFVFRKIEALRDFNYGKTWIICTENCLFYNKIEFFFVK